jgi:glycosyltransferase involved in cell wall biosynthesis
MKNIWILNHYAITPDMPGGTRHYDFGKKLVKRGYNVTIFASSFHYTQHKELKLKKKEKYKIENVDGINFVWIKTFPYQKNNWRRVINMISYMWRVYWLGEKITKTDENIKKPDIIIGSSVHLLAVLSAYWLSKYYEVKFIMEVRDLWPQTLIDFKKFKKNHPIIKILKSLEKFLYKKAQKIIVLLPLASKYIINLGIDKNKIFWIPNGTDLNKFKRMEAKKNESKNEYFKIIYLGAHGQANALETILNAAKIIQDEKKYKKIKFTFIGDGSEKKNLEKYSEKLLLKNVKFCSPIKKRKIPEALTDADILIFNLKKSDVFKYGISSNKLFDYMAATKPIIFAANTANNPIREARCGLPVPPENPEKMAEAIIKLYKMPLEEREKMGQRGREYVEKYHSIPVLVDKLEKVIQKTVHNKLYYKMPLN